MALPGKIHVVDSEGVQRLLSMGEGAQALSQVGVHAGNMTEMCRLVGQVCRAVGCDAEVLPVQLAVSACESHRRGGFGGRVFAHREAFAC